VLRGKGGLGQPRRPLHPMSTLRRGSLVVNYSQGRGLVKDTWIWDEAHNAEPRRRSLVLINRYIERAETWRAFLEVSEAMALELPRAAPSPGLPLIDASDDRASSSTSSVPQGRPSDVVGFLITTRRNPSRHRQLHRLGR